MMTTQRSIAVLLMAALVWTVVGCSQPTPAGGPAANGAPADVAAEQAGQNEPADGMDQPAEEGAADESSGDGPDPAGAGQPAEPAAAGRLQLEPPPPAGNQGLVTGYVVDSEGSGLVDVALTIPESSVPVPQIAIYSTADGLYAWYVPPGEHTLRAERDGYQAAEQTVEVEAGEIVELDFTLEDQ